MACLIEVDSVGSSRKMKHTRNGISQQGEAGKQRRHMFTAGKLLHADQGKRTLDKLAERFLLNDLTPVKSSTIDRPTHHCNRQVWGCITRCTVRRHLFGPFVECLVNDRCDLGLNHGQKLLIFRQTAAEQLREKLAGGQGQQAQVLGVEAFGNPLEQRLPEQIAQEYSNRVYLSAKCP